MPVWIGGKGLLEENCMSIIVSNNLGIPPYQLIMNVTMFDHLIYEVDMKWYKLNIKISDDESFVRNLRSAPIRL